jgi:hypothetical protein
MKYCKYCQREVQPIESKNDTGCIMGLLKLCMVIFLTSITMGLFLLLYLPARSYSKHCNMVCPICNAKI